MNKPLTYIMLGAVGAMAYQTYSQRNNRSIDKAMKKMSEVNRDTMRWIKSKM